MPLLANHIGRLISDFLICYYTRLCDTVHSIHTVCMYTVCAQYVQCINLLVRQKRRESAAER